VEAITLSPVGEVLGIPLAVALSRLISLVAGWATLMNAWAVALAFGFATAVGVCFGLYPARWAASMDPITALRYE